MSSAQPHLVCPCGSQLGYSACCGCYIEGKVIPEIAEALMRSRYTAYTQGNIAYIQATMQGKAAEGFDPIEAKRWAQSIRWKRLKVLRTYGHNTETDTYYVEFIVHYIDHGKPQQIKECSEFRRIHDRWYYVDGISLQG